MNITITNPTNLTNRAQFTRVQSNQSTRRNETASDFSGALNQFGVVAAFTCTPEFLTECNLHGIRNVKFDYLTVEHGITFLHFQAFIEFDVEDMCGKKTGRVGTSQGHFIVPMSRDMKLEIR